MRIVAWILGQRGARFLTGVLVLALWSVPVAAVVLGLPEWHVRRADTAHATMWIAGLLLLAMTVLLTFVLEETLGHRRVISALRCAPSTVACALIAFLAITYPPRGERSGGHALEVETLAAVVIVAWAARRWRRHRAVPIPNARAVRRTPR